MVDTTNLVSYYKFDENAASTDVADAHAANTGTSTTDTSNLYNATGIINSDFYFNAASTYGISMGNVFNFDYDEPFSVSGWVENANPLDGGDAAIFSKEDINAPYYGYALSYRYETASKFFRFDWLRLGEYIEIDWNYVLSPSSRYHVLFTYDGSGTIAGIKLYVDGSLVSKTTTTGSLSGSATTAIEFNIAKRDNSSQYWTGEMDEFGIWAEALTSTNATELYNSGAGLAYPFTPPTPPPAETPEGTVGTYEIATRYPVTEGLIADTTKQTGNPNLIATEEGAF